MVFSLAIKQSSSQILLLCSVLGIASGCHKGNDHTFSDHARLTPKVVLRDVSFHSAALNREMTYRVLMPAAISPETKLPVAYLLHGGNGGFRDWSNYSDVARFAAKDLILVMPEGDESYYTNSAEHPQDRYEEYVVNDLIGDVEARFPVADEPGKRAIIGISMGGFGAVKLVLRHPELFVFAGGLSSAIDVPSRSFSIHRIGPWRHHASIFGPLGSATRRENDPFLLARSANPAKTPYFFLTCGDQEGLLPANRSFAKLLQERGFKYEFHVVSGGHHWHEWNAQLEAMFHSLWQHLATEH